MPNPVEESPALTVIVLWARRSRELALDQVTAFETVILPALAKGLVVSTITLLVARAVCSVVTFSVDVAVVPVNVGAALILALAADEMVMLLGSNRSVPVCPAGAVVSTRPVKSRACLPETSTKPPWPPEAPPCAEMVPAY